MQLAVKVAHEYLNKRILVVATGPDGPAFRLHGDHTLLAGGEGTLRAARAAQTSRRAIAELLRDGETGVSSWDIFDSFPDLFGRTSTRALRVLMSGAFDRLGTPTDAGQ